MNIYLFYNGTCEEAMHFYKEATNGHIDAMSRFGDMGQHVEEHIKNRIMHGVMTINGCKVMFSDTDDKRVINFGDNFSLALDYKDETEMEAVYVKLCEGGVVTMPLQDTFWGAKFGMCRDKFGVNWMFNFDRPKQN